ncbi:cellulase [Paludibacter sp. 221]|uniref:glycoside hydrolase family 9 protein n=1 Tax=Paludibacter sp. 221 TaxID=2302939 RepID=UPI0013D027AC|nr:glycoside hydrolase family 9 protein [Paludibacter sp. 221]NDV47835.1 cellulase [Paludibacter sp. 221]
MRKKLVLGILFLLPFVCVLAVDSWIRINQVGYLPEGRKEAVLISESVLNVKGFDILDALTGEKLAESETVKNTGKYGYFKSTYVLDFSNFNHTGAFYIKAGDVYSPVIYINKNVYLGTADFLLNYLRQQRCGHNSSLEKPCHLRDGFVEPEVENTKRTLKSEPKIDVTGGWHHESGNIKYASTTAVSVYQLLFAYQKHPTAFADEFDAEGKPGANGIPDILDEAKWGLDWMLKMYPEKNTLYHQVGDARDYSGFKLPYEDNTDYGWGAGKERPIHRATGKPQGLFKQKNQSTGVASLAGKYASAFALGSAFFADYYPEYSELLEKKAFEAYQYGKEFPGVTQSVPGHSLYYMEEANWTDDMELAAIHLFRLSFDYEYADDAANYGRMEPVSPWVFSDTLRHYQWYPFHNTGHYMLARLENPRYKKEFTENLRVGLERGFLRAKESPFMVDVPFVQSSNNMVIALATQCRLYRELTNDSTYIGMENALVDWVLGRNPWGISMVVGLPQNNNSVSHAHSSLLYKKGVQPKGGVVGGPVGRSVFEHLQETTLLEPERFERYHVNDVVYHDDIEDHVTNAPAIDRTSALAYLLAGKQIEGVESKTRDKNSYLYGGITRTNPEKKEISLVFYAHDFADGYKTIEKVLKDRKIKAAFFFTGDFYRKAKNGKMIKSLKGAGHYLGAHSDKNIQYCSWENRNELLVTKEEFAADLQNNFKAMKKFGIKKEDAPFFLPPYQWYNADISRWCKELGLQLVSFTPGTYTNADYTIPEMRNQYYSSQEIYGKVMQIEQQSGLNGYVMLFSLGADDRRTDKFYDLLDDLLTDLESKGYKFVDLYKATDVF